MKAVKNSIRFLPLVLVGLSGGCDQPAVDWQPILERSTSHVLRVEVERVSDAVEEAASMAAGSNPEEILTQLQVAERSLRHLLDFYLPLMEAREHAYNALLFFNLGKVDRTHEELDLSEDLLEAIARVDEGKLLREMEPPLEELGDARAAIGADPVIAHELLQNLTTRLNNMVLKGGLIVD
jgi:hypothetical protein